MESYLLDRGRSVPQILARAQEEIRTRPDVYGWDLLAWALYRSGKLSAALRAAERALGMGTRDASLYYHAGTVAAAAGERARATRWLEEALAINPRWHPTQPDEARDAPAPPLRSQRPMSEIAAFVRLGVHHIADPSALDHGSSCWHSPPSTAAVTGDRRSA